MQKITLTNIPLYNMDETYFCPLSDDDISGVIPYDKPIQKSRMKENMDQLKGLVNSQQVLLKLTQSNISREDAYSIVQEIAMQVWDGKGSFLSLLKENKTIKDKISEEELVELFDENYHTKNTDFIFNRVFKDE